MIKEKCLKQSQLGSDERESFLGYPEPIRKELQRRHTKLLKEIDEYVAFTRAVTPAESKAIN